MHTIELSNGGDMAVEGPGSVSGLCLMVRPDHLDDVEAELDDLPWVEIHARDDTTSRLVVVQEHATVKEHQEGLRQLQAIPHVLTADLVVHRTLEDEDQEDRRS